MNDINLRPINYSEVKFQSTRMGHKVGPSFCSKSILSKLTFFETRISGNNRRNAFVSFSSYSLEVMILIDLLKHNFRIQPASVM